MLTHNTPVEDHRTEWGLMVKREDLSCPPPGPPFSKTRGVWAHLEKRPERVVGVLDTYHSQAGHAVAAANALLGKKTVNFYPRYKASYDEIRHQQVVARELGAQLVGLDAGPSWYLYHQAKTWLAANYGTEDAYMMPNALKLDEMVEETAEEVRRTLNDWPSLVERPKLVILPSSSATIASGVMEGFRRHTPPDTETLFMVHMGYHRSVSAIQKGVEKKLGYLPKFSITDEGYNYKDQARPGPTPQWPCNAYYDLKAFRWWRREGVELYGHLATLFWNVG